MATLLNVGIYSIPEAVRLTGVSPWRIRRWLRGYDFKTKHGRHRSAPVWQGELAPIDHSIALGFLDLLEVKCVDAFLKAGVIWKTLRQAHDRAREIVKHTHPFCTSHFATDGKAIFVELQERNEELVLWDIASVQGVFDRIIRPFLKELEFSEKEIATRWWPMGKNRMVVLDPRRSFGQPIVSHSGVPTSILGRAVRAAGSTREVAAWYEVSPSEINDAVAFEKQIAA